MNRFASRFLSIVCAFVCLLSVPSLAPASVRAYAAKGTAQFTSPTQFVGSGNATHLGRYSEAGTVSFSPTGNPAVAHVDGTIVYTAASGDELHAVVSGELNFATGAVTAVITYVGGTGRFDDATGNSILTGQLGGGGMISVAVGGTIDY